MQGISMPLHVGSLARRNFLAKLIRKVATISAGGPVFEKAFQGYQTVGRVYAHGGPPTAFGENSRWPFGYSFADCADATASGLAFKPIVSK